MRIRITLLSLLASLLSTGFVFTSAPVANAGCRDYPESVTPACAAQNLAEEQARQAAAEVLRAKQLADADAAAKANAELEYVRCVNTWNYWEIYSWNIGRPTCIMCISSCNRC